MKGFFSKVWKFGKTVVIPAAAMAVPFVAQGYLGPKAQAVAVGLIAVWGVLSRRPQDVTPTEQAEKTTQVAVQDLLTLQQQAAKGRK